MLKCQFIEPPADPSQPFDQKNLQACLRDAGHPGGHTFVKVDACDDCGSLYKKGEKHSCTPGEATTMRLRQIVVQNNTIIQLLQSVNIYLQMFARVSGINIETGEVQPPRIITPN